MKKIISVSLAVLSLVVLGFYNFIVQPANALDQFTITYPAGGTNCFAKTIQLSSNSYVVTVCDANVAVYKQTDFTVFGTFNYLTGLQGGSFSNYALQSLNCDITSNSGFCATYLLGSGGKASRVIILDINNLVGSTLNSGLNLTSGFNGVVALNGGSNTGGGVGQTTVFVSYYDTGVNHIKVASYFMNNTQPVGCAGTSLCVNRLVNAWTTDTLQNANTPAAMVFGTTPIPNVQNYLGIMTSSGNFMSFNIGAQTNCLASLGVATAQGDVDYTSDTNGAYFTISRADTNIYKIIPSSCAKTQVDVSVIGSGNLVRGISHSNTRHEIYLTFTGINKMIVINETTFAQSGTASTLSTWSHTTGAGDYQNLVTADDLQGQTTTNGFIGMGRNGAMDVIFWNARNSAGGGNSPPQNTCNAQSGNPKDCVGQIDCSNPANANLALCFINQNPRFNNGFSGTGGMLNSSVTTLSCSIGLVKCVFDSNGNGTPINGNVQTNGVGYLIAIIGLAILISIFWVASDHDLRNIPTFVWFIGVLGLLGALVALQWLDPTFFIVAIIAVVGLAAAKARGLFDSF